MVRKETSSQEVFITLFYEEKEVLRIFSCNKDSFKGFAQQRRKRKPYECEMSRVIDFYFIIDLLF